MDKMENKKRYSASMKEPLRILQSSDLSWAKEDINSLYDKISLFKPHIVVLAGDILMDGLSKNEKPSSEDLLKILRFLEEKKVYCLLVRGNHDEDYITEYNELDNKILGLSYVFEISGKAINICGVKFYGIPFSEARNKGYFAKITEQIKDNCDIIITHSQKRAKPSLCNLNINLILRGHSDTTLDVFEKSFIVNTDVSDFALIDYFSKEDFDIVFHKKDLDYDISKKKKKVAYSVREGILSKMENESEEEEIAREEESRKFLLLLEAKRDYNSQEDKLNFFIKLLKSGLNLYTLEFFLPRNRALYKANKLVNLENNRT